MTTDSDKNAVPTYVNKKGVPVVVQITPHARQRFMQRWKLIFPDKPLQMPVDEMIAVYFNQASKVEALTRRDQLRMKKHGKDTLYFRHGTFTFVVQNATIVTVEISDNNRRYLNRPKFPRR